MNHWLVKSEPSAYSWADLQRDGHTRWDGVRNYQARNNLAAMRTGDLVLFYHSVDDRAVVGIARVTTEAYADPTTGDAGWLAVDLVPVETLSRPVSLDEIKAQRSLAGMALVKQGRLSVTPVTPEEFRTLLALGKRAATTADTRAAKGAGAAHKDRAGKKTSSRGKKTTRKRPTRRAR